MCFDQSIPLHTILYSNHHHYSMQHLLELHPVIKIVFEKGSPSSHTNNARSIPFSQHPIQLVEMKAQQPKRIIVVLTLSLTLIKVPNDPKRDSCHSNNSSSTCDMHTISCQVRLVIVPLNDIVHITCLIASIAMLLILMAIVHPTIVENLSSYSEHSSKETLLLLPSLVVYRPPNLVCAPYQEMAEKSIHYPYHIPLAQMISSQRTLQFTSQLGHSHLPILLLQ